MRLVLMYPPLDVAIPACASTAYQVHIGAGLLGIAGGLIAPFCPRKQSVIITDSNVAKHHLSPLQASLMSAGISAQAVVLTPGEESKNFAMLAHVVDALLSADIERTDAIIALGGGVIGDLVGFAAAIVRRGCRFIQIPTTLLAQVDSSVGGKTAVNTARGKNLVGAFHNPALVLADIDTLATLPMRERRAGYAEIVKYGLINDAGFFAWLEQNGKALLEGDGALITQAVYKSITAKAAIVAQDPYETNGKRALLNLGHTFGHALEAEAGFGQALLHGEAVAIGCVLAFKTSVRLGLCAPEDAVRVQAHLHSVGLPTLPAQVGIGCGAAPLLAHIAQDKKRQAGQVPFLLARGIGETFLAKAVDPAILTDVLNQGCAGTL
jgi:3-dehydroquinate synthase